MKSTTAFDDQFETEKTVTFCQLANPHDDMAAYNNRYFPDAENYAQHVAAEQKENPTMEKM